MTTTNGQTSSGPLPPRPNAIVTLLTSDDFLPGAQTLLYSVKKNMTPSPLSGYPPELVVLTTPNVSPATIKTISRHCARVISISPIIPSDTTPSHVDSFLQSFSKLHIFRLQEYDQILYIDADCLVLKDVSHIFQTKLPNTTTGLLSAAPDIFPPDKFNAGVMLLRPDVEIFQSMMDRLTADKLESYDGGDTGFLNGVFSNWYGGMPAASRLPFRYNAQRFMWECTYKKNRKYWEEAVGEIVILHFSSSNKPWEKGAKTGELTDLWRSWYEQIEGLKRKAKPKRNTQDNSVHQKPTKTIHTSFPKRFKDLRKEGMSSKEAMIQTRKDCALDVNDHDDDPAKKVAAMFGLS